MPMAMMQVRHVRMLVAQAGVVMPMRVRLTGWIARFVRMLVMRIVLMRMSVLQ